MPFPAVGSSTPSSSPLLSRSSFASSSSSSAGELWNGLGQEGGRDEQQWRSHPSRTDTENIRATAPAQSPASTARRSAIDELGFIASKMGSAAQSDSGNDSGLLDTESGAQGSTAQGNPASAALSARGAAGTGATKVSKRKSRASNKTPITVLSADTSNFRDMVQKLTGIPPSALPHLPWHSKALEQLLMMKPQPQGGRLPPGMPTLDTSAPFLFAGQNVWAGRQQAAGGSAGVLTGGAPYGRHVDMLLDASRCGRPQEAHAAYSAAGASRAPAGEAANSAAATRVNAGIGAAATRVNTGIGAAARATPLMHPNCGAAPTATAARAPPSLPSLWDPPDHRSTRRARPSPSSSSAQAHALAIESLLSMENLSPTPGDTWASFDGPFAANKTTGLK